MNIRKNKGKKQIYAQMNYIMEQNRFKLIGVEFCRTNSIANRI